MIGIDLTTLFFLILAVVIILRLRSVLGRRTGNERPGYDPYQRQGQPGGSDSGGSDNVIAMPRSEGTTLTGRDDHSAVERIREYMPESNPAQPGLIEIATADPSFDPKEFLAGAKVAYEMVVTAFSEGNRDTLGQLLSDEVFEGFDAAITDRETRGYVADSSFVGIDRADIIDAELKDGEALVTVKFVSQLISAIRDRDGMVVEGDPDKVREVTDIWTFSRSLSSRDPNWKLVATQTAN